MINFKSILCSHDYELINQFEMVSQYDIVVANGYIPNTWNRLTRKHVTDYKCTKCNKFKRLVIKTSK